MTQFKKPISNDFGSLNMIPVPPTSRRAIKRHFLGVAGLTVGGRGTSVTATSVFALTHHAVLHGEAELVLGVRPLYLDFDDRGARDGGELHGRLVLGVLQRGIDEGDESGRGRGEGRN